MDVLFHLFNHLIVGIDALCQKKLARAVPNLPALLRDPGRVLAEQAVIIRPAARYGSKLACFLLLIFVGLGVMGLVSDHMIGKRPLPPPVQLMVFAVCLGAPVAAWLIVRTIFRGATCVLTPQGVELRSGGTTVFCPWALFDTAGQPLFFQYHSVAKVDRFVLPVQSAAAPLVELRRGEQVLLQGRAVRTRRLRFRSNGDAELASLYEVSGAELGQLLLRLGGMLAQPLPALPEAEVVESALDGPLIQEGAGGWVTVPLTRLSFPPFCCDCGARTSTRRPFAASPPLFRIGRIAMLGSNPIWLQIPYCVPCQRANKKRFGRLFLRGMGTGILLALLAGLVTGALVLGAGNPAGLVCALIWLFPGILLGVLLGRYAGRRASTPVELRDYSPRRRTVALRFRWREYTQAVVATTEAGVPS